MLIFNAHFQWVKCEDVTVRDRPSSRSVVSVVSAVFALSLTRYFQQCECECECECEFYFAHGDNGTELLCIFLLYSFQISLCDHSCAGIDETFFKGIARCPWG
jgi:hypothetical protein